MNFTFVVHIFFYSLQLIKKKKKSDTKPISAIPDPALIHWSQSLVGWREQNKNGGGRELLSE